MKLKISQLVLHEFRDSGDVIEYSSWAFCASGVFFIASMYRTFLNVFGHVLTKAFVVADL